LIEFYKEHAEGKNLEIIFLSSDSDQESFDEYYKDMPWLTLDFKERDKQEELSDKFHVSGIPKFILLDGDSGDIISTDARDQIQTKDTKGDNFPWKSEE
jgi:nucleoredoxin